MTALEGSTIITTSTNMLYSMGASKETIESLKRVYDGSPKMIRRSNGGYSPATPHRTHFWIEEGQIQIFVEVRFRDYVKTPKRGKPVPTEMLKVVPLKDILTPNCFHTRPDQRYLVDFGDGPIPVAVVDYAISSGEKVALIVDVGAIKNLERDPKGRSLEISCYVIPRDLLRDASCPQENRNYQRARFNHRRLVAHGGSAIPGSLAFRSSVNIPSGLSIHQATQVMGSLLSLDSTCSGVFSYMNAA